MAVAGVELGHFTYPFTFGPTGAANVAEQDSDQEIASCVANILVCPPGFRADLPDFGSPDPTFGTVPLNTEAERVAIARYEPRAHTVLSEIPGSADILNIAINQDRVL